MCVRRAIGRLYCSFLSVVRTVENQEQQKPMMKLPLRLVTPTIEKRTVTPPRRKPNAELRTREYLTEAEIDKLSDAAKWNRWGAPPPGSWLRSRTPCVRAS